MQTGKAIRRIFADFLSGLKENLPYIAMLALVNVIIYRDFWLGTKIFSGKDTFTAYMPLINYQSDCLKEFSMPLWNPFLNFGFPYVEDVLNSVFFPTHLLMGLFTGSSMLIYQRDLLFWIFMGGLGIYLCVRELGFSKTAGLVSGAAFMFCGQLVSLPTWSIMIYNACCFPYLILGYHRAKRSGDFFSFLSIVFFALPVYSGYVSSSVHAIYYFIGYVLIDSLFSGKFLFGVKYLASTLFFGLMLSLPKLVPVALSMGDYERMSVAETKANPLEVITLYNFMSFVLPVKYYFSLYIGELGIIALIYSALKKTIKVNALLVMFILSGWLLLVDRDGDFSLLHSVANAVLPMMKLTRNEWMYWNYPLTFAILYLSRYISGFLEGGDLKLKAIAAGGFVLVMSAAFFGEYNVEVHYRAYIMHCILAVLWFSAGIAAQRKYVKTFFVLLIVLAEFMTVFDRTNIDRPVVRAGNELQVTLTHQVYSSESFMDGELVKQTMPMKVVPDDERPSVGDSRKTPYLISGLDGNFVDNMNLKRFTGWWYNTQERSDFVALKDSPQLAMLDGAPLYNYIDLSSGGPLGAEISFDGISCSDFSFRLRSAAPGLFVLHQMYDKRWKLFVDGAELPVAKAEKYFMGAEIMPGEHSLRFVFSDRNFTVCLFISGLTLLGLFSIMTIKVLRSGKDEREFNV